MSRGIADALVVGMGLAAAVLNLGAALVRLLEARAGRTGRPAEVQAGRHRRR